MQHVTAPLAALFDMDGLLVDSEPLWQAVTDEFCRRRGGRYSVNDIWACTGIGVAKTVRLLSERHGWPLDEPAQVAEIQDAFAARAAGTPALPTAEATLRALHGRVPLGLGSSTHRRLVEAALAPRGWLTLFDAVVTGSDGHALKPEPAIYLALARELGVPAERCVVFEDSLPGCQAGRAAGMTVVAVPAPGAALAPYQAVSDLIVMDVAEGARRVGL